MDMKLFFSTFLLIFLAELGDKTQLAAMARTATAESARWTVFTAAAAALVLSTLIAVLLGSALARVVPEHVIRMGAAILFMLFGLLLFRDALARREARGEAAVPAGVPTGLLARVVLRAAAGFERAAAEDYHRLAAQAATPELAGLFNRLARSEEAHLERLLGAGTRHGETPMPAAGISGERIAALAHDVAEGAAPVLEHAIGHELATAAFYRELARDTPFAPLERIFLALAAEEDEHARDLAGALQAAPGAGTAIT